MKNLIAALLILITPFTFPQSGKESCILGKTAQFNRLKKLVEVNYPGDPKYDVKYYKLDLTINHTSQTISGNITCNAKVVQSNVTEIYYDFINSMIVDSVLFNGNNTSFSRGTNTVVVQTNTSLNQGDDLTTVVYYHGTPASGGFGSFEFSSQGGNPLIWSLSEPYGAKDWWVVKDTPADKADSADIWLTVSTSLTPVSNGNLMEVVNNGNGTHTYKWHVSYPIAPYLVSLAITNYALYTNYYHYSPTDSMPITHYLYPSSLNSNISQLNKTPGMIEIFAERFGEYPFINEKYGHAQFGWGGGMEHQTISSMGGFGDGLIAHELAHMWYGDNITCKDWHHIWLNEGFATMGEGLIYEAWNGKAAYNSYIADEMYYAKFASGTIYVQDISSEWEIFNSYRTYSKACVVLHMLRGIVGDSTFFNILRTYSYDPSVAYGNAVTEDFQAIAENVSGLDLNYFFQQWIYGVNYPTYSVVWSKNSLGGNLYDLALKITQSSNSNPSFFTMPIQIKVNSSTGDTIITVFNNAQVQNFNITVANEPISITVDPNNWILKTINSVVVGIEDEMQPQTFSLEQNYPNPFNPVTKIKFTLASNEYTTLKVYDIIGKEITTLVNNQMEKGHYEINFDASNLPSGVYLYTLNAGGYKETRKMILMR
ncbi:MAG: T9SS type A sorting domain-containing protein [Ignavibacteriota bacterium]|nr:T9SS C-terminal target domain-containing protein [Ignavibacteriota bacterium]MCO6447838.1 T9SS type A sorting domain-containing protein [Ignavibacterium album]QKJ99857.1 MAG: T9SS type A sorting domain-containing protein [Ignavibacteriota bacterium]HOJ06566.1 M1 family aminopeptidase [Ignavibacteriaceae bacterium]